MVFGSGAGRESRMVAARILSQFSTVGELVTISEQISDLGRVNSPHLRLSVFLLVFRQCINAEGLIT